MTTSPAVCAARTENPPSLTTVLTAGTLFGLAGFAVNLLKLELFFNVDFLFGSIITMFALLRYGTATGTLAALVAATCTWFLWHHPWAIIIFTLEAYVAGLLAKKRRWELVTGDIFFWCSIGLLLVVIFYHQVMSFTPWASLLIALKQGVNGIFNTLVAMGLNVAFAYRSRTRQLPSLYQILFVSMSLFVLIPAVGFLYYDIQRSMSRQLSNYREETARVCDVAEHSTSLWLTLNKDTVKSLAELAGTPQRIAQPELQRIVEALRTTNPEFKRMGIIDTSSVTQAFSPKFDEFGISTIGINLSDRPFIPRIKSPSHPFVFFVFTGKIGSPGPRLILLAPILDKDTYHGAAFGVVDFSALQHLLKEAIGKRAMTVTVIDNKDRVVISTNEALKPTEAYTLPRGGTVAPLENGVGQWMPAQQPGVSAAKRWLASFYVRQLPLTIGNGWKVVIETSLTPQIEELSRQTSVSLGIIAFLILATITLSRLLAAKFSSILHTLEDVTQQLPLRIASGEAVSWPQPMTSEMTGLMANFQAMGTEIRTHVAELARLNQSTEQLVEERTRELRESEALFRTLSFQAPVGIYRTDLGGNCIYVNNTWCQLTGLIEAEARGTGWTKALHPDDRDRVFAEWNEAIRNNHIFSSEYRFLTPDGTVNWVSGIASSLVTASNTITGYIGCISDITKRKQAEETLKRSEADLVAAQAISRMGSWRLVYDGNKERWSGSDELYSIYGYPRSMQLTMQTGLDRMYPDDLEDVKTSWLSALDGTGPDEWEHRIVVNDRIKWLSVRVKFDFNGDGTLREAHGVVQDITERKQLEADVAQALQEAKDANAAMSRLLHIIAHEFRTPLGLLLGSADILDRYWDRLTPEKRLEQNGHIRSATRQLSHLINSVISFSRKKVCTDEMQLMPLDIGSVSRAVATEVATVWGSGRECSVRIAADCGRAVLDEMLLRRVLENLLTNAFRYTPPNGTVSLRVERKPDRILFEIADTGIGIPEDEQAFIFDAFYRSRNIEGQRGLGLGLSIVQDALSRLGGTISVQSTVGRGTVMTVAIPLGNPS